MTLFRVVLVIMFAVMIGYTAAVGIAHGWGLFPIFFGDIVALTWPGQFNVDFTCLLILSGLWVAWRSHFTAGGIFLGLLTTVGGTLVFAPYLLFACLQAKNDLKVLLLGRMRAAG
ncbi:MAG: hypothetical protein ING33_10040 [Rhodocyclaceae bacterium]|nr:hypothetical protein [Rhodocyclaceae bacterium]MCA3043418.1 hypothetical protein [Rhodocyclaceae bacterium]MCA3061705.1 hypothetical protein [Rhodocyclaceae bacterium]